MESASPSPLRPVRFPLDVLPGESIRGYVHRVAEHNTYEKPSQLLDLVDADLDALWEGNVDIPALAHLYGASENALESALPRSDRSGATLTVYGASYPRREFRTTLCPVSPSGLKRSGHHQFSWSLRQLTFCPQDLSLLLFNCPRTGCARPLCWRDRPMHLCAACGLDLRTVKARKIRSHHRAYLKVAAGLVSFDEQVRNESVDKFPACLTALSPFEVLQAVLVIGRALRDANHPLAAVLRPPPRYPVAMLAGMRFFLDQQGQSASGADATKAPWTRDAKLRAALKVYASKAPVDVREAISRLHEEGPHCQWIRPSAQATNLTIAARKLRVGRKVAKTLLERGVMKGRAIGGGADRVHSVVDEANLADLVKEAEARISVAQLAEQYGLKSSWILQMAALGLIERATHPLIAIAYNEVQFTKASATAYLDRILGAIVRTDPSDRERVLLRDVFISLGPGAKPWLQAIMAPKLLPDGLGSFEPRGANCSALTVTRRCAQLLQSGKFSFPPTRIPVSSAIKLIEAQEHLNCHPRDIAALIRIGALQRAAKGVCMASVEVCCSTLISTAEVAARAGIPAVEFAAVAKSSGLLRPHPRAGFWDRKAAEAVFALSPSRIG